MLRILHSIIIACIVYQAYIHTQTYTRGRTQITEYDTVKLIQFTLCIANDSNLNCN